MPISWSLYIGCEGRSKNLDSDDAPTEQPPLYRYDQRDDLLEWTASMPAKDVIASLPSSVPLCVAGVTDRYDGPDWTRLQPWFPLTLDLTSVASG